MNNRLKRLAFLGLVLCLPPSLALAADPEPKPYVFKIETLEAQPTVSMRFKVPPVSEKISAKYAEAFTAIFGHVISNGGQPSGAPFGRYHAVKDDELDIEAGVAVVAAVEGKGDIKASELPGGKVITTIHFGPYDKLGIAHAAIQKWAGEHGHKPNGAIWEAYLTDPGAEPDQSKWQTKLFLPIAAKDAAEPK